MIVDYLALKKRLKERNMEECGYGLSKRLASNEKITQDIVKDIAPINEKLVEMNRNIELKREISHPKIGSKQRLVSGTDYSPLAFIRNHMDRIVVRHLVYTSRMENS